MHETKINFILDLLILVVLLLCCKYNAKQKLNFYTFHHDINVFFITVEMNGENCYKIWTFIQCCANTTIEMRATDYNLVLSQKMKNVLVEHLYISVSYLLFSMRLTLNEYLIRMNYYQAYYTRITG